LKPTFQQALPAACGSTSPDANHYDKNFLYIVTNTPFGPRLNKFHHYYGKLNLATGEWVKLLKSPKGTIGDDYLASSNVLWFTDGFIIPYIKSHYFDSTDIDLQLNTY